MASEPQGASRDDTVAAAGLISVGIAATVLLLTWCGAALAAEATGHTAPPFTASGAWASLRQPADPATAWATPMPSPVVVWAITGLVTATVGGLAVAAFRAWRRRVGPPGRIGYPDGTATRNEVLRVAGERSLMARATHLRPGLHKPAPADCGQLLGHSRGAAVWSPVEDSRVIVGPPRSGKGLHLVIPMILDAPGAVVTNSTRPDNLTATMAAREKIGPVAVFDPQGLAPGISNGLRWSPVRGCEDPETAMVRARGLAAGSGVGGKGVENGAFWQGQTEAVLRGMLHAAALAGHTPRDLYRWSLDPVAALECARVLADSPRAAYGWGSALEAAATADQRTRDSIWLGVRSALGALAAPKVLAAVSPSPGEEFDPAQFLRAKGTLYLIGTSSGAGNAGALINALIEDLVETARRLAAASPRARLDPPLNLILDELHNFLAISSLPSLMSEGGGSGMVTTAVFQSVAQIRDGYGENLAHAIWDSAIAKVILGGGSTPKDLQDLVTLIGERDEETVSLSRSTGRGDGSRSRQVSLRRVPILDAAKIRTLPFGTGLLLLRSAAPIMLTLTDWRRRPDANEITAARDAVAERISDAFATQSGAPEARVA
ncbi:TraM recognition domain-containing protein [Jiangella rhizosphaerae]|uniref:Type VI secretion protein n=1 Tax=Jiangella rhizosphaerae TaxID=2293569 RepID=A0A418KY28_9ACTN|nr:TraM recognition domain-containing protein [Jiangella rhizosphaerae]RIQ36989.1 type VI secretion protein [Jiangella rhizosphaerae]